MQEVELLGFAHASIITAVVTESFVGAIVPYISANPEHTPHTSNIQLPVKLILKSYQNSASNSNIQGNDIMENSFTHCIIHVMPLVTLICNEKLLSSCPTKTIMNKRGFSQTKWIN